MPLPLVLGSDPGGVQCITLLTTSTNLQCSFPIRTSISIGRAPLVKPEPCQEHYTKFKAAMKDLYWSLWPNICGMVSQSNNVSNYHTLWIIIHTPALSQTTSYYSWGINTLNKIVLAYKFPMHRDTCICLCKLAIYIWNIRLIHGGPVQHCYELVEALQQCMVLNACWTDGSIFMNKQWSNFTTLKLISVRALKKKIK